MFPVRLCLCTPSCHFAEAVTPRLFEGGRCTATPQQWNHKRCTVNPPMRDPLKVSFQNRLAKLHLDLRPGRLHPAPPEVRSSPCFSGPCMLAIQHFIRIPPRSSQKPGPRDMASTCLRLSSVPIYGNPDLRVICRNGQKTTSEGDQRRPSFQLGFFGACAESPLASRHSTMKAHARSALGEHPCRLRTDRTWRRCRLSCPARHIVSRYIILNYHAMFCYVVLSWVKQ